MIKLRQAHSIHFHSDNQLCASLLFTLLLELFVLTRPIKTVSVTFQLNTQATVPNKLIFAKLQGQGMTETPD